MAATCPALQACFKYEMQQGDCHIWVGVFLYFFAALGGLSSPRAQGVLWCFIPYFFADEPAASQSTRLASHIFPYGISLQELTW